MADRNNTMNALEIRYNEAQMALDEAEGRMAAVKRIAQIAEGAESLQEQMNIVQQEAIEASKEVAYHLNSHHSFCYLEAYLIEMREWLKEAMHEVGQ